MSRAKITEYRAKKLLIGASYEGLSCSSPTPSKFQGKVVVKLDQGVKQRFKKGLIGVNVSGASARSLIKSWQKKGFSQFLIEPYITHKKEGERYLSLERVRDGIALLHAESGGVDIETQVDQVQKYTIREAADVKLCSKKFKLPEVFLSNIVSVFETNHFSFLEINPLLVIGTKIHILDAAVLVDTAAESLVSGVWTSADIVESKRKHKEERIVSALQKTTPASLQLTVLNPKANLFFLLSGGGGSIVIADEAQLQGAGLLIGNYGEYSGGPTREETYLYAREIISLLLRSSAKKKALVIAGGIANFTDVQETFLGIIDALSEREVELRKQKAKVFVRRGGPNERAGLQSMQNYLKKAGLMGSVHGSQSPITCAVTDAITYVRV